MNDNTNSSKRPFILLTNDDGVNSPGLHALASAILPFADIRIIAPSHQMTATGRGLFGDRHAQLETSELTINQTKIIAYHAPCSPAQVVMLGAKIFREEREPDLLISGINYGENMGRDITMSGTVGAAIQAACMGIPALAMSMQTPINGHFIHSEADWSAASFFSAKFARLMLERKMPPDVDLLKVDVPETATEDTPWQVTRQANKSYFTAEFKKPVKNSSLADSEVKALRDLQDLDTNSDIYVFLKKDVVVVTPISLDFTSRTDLNKLQSYLKSDDEN